MIFLKQCLPINYAESEVVIAQCALKDKWHDFTEENTSFLPEEIKPYVISLNLTQWTIYDFR